MQRARRVGLWDQECLCPDFCGENGRLEMHTRVRGSRSDCWEAVYTRSPREHTSGIAGDPSVQLAASSASASVSFSHTCCLPLAVRSQSRERHVAECGPIQSRMGTKWNEPLASLAVITANGQQGVCASVSHFVHNGSYPSL